jgi:hypothetical protein
MLPIQFAECLTVCAISNKRRPSIALDLVKRTRRNPIRAGRGLALLHAAINDAVVAAFDSKEAYFRERPAVVEPAILQQGPIAPASPPSLPSRPRSQGRHRRC